MNYHLSDSTLLHQSNGASITSVYQCLRIAFILGMSPDSSNYPLQPYPTLSYIYSKKGHLLTPLSKKVIFLPKVRTKCTHSVHQNLLNFAPYLPKVRTAIQLIKYFSTT